MLMERVKVEISAIPEIPEIPSIPDGNGISFRWTSQQSLKSLEFQASLMLLEARSGGNFSNLSNPWDCKHPNVARISFKQKSKQSHKSLETQASLMLLECPSDGNPDKSSDP
jgi:hypothetical protein